MSKRLPKIEKCPKKDHDEHRGAILALDWYGLWNSLHQNNLESFEPERPGP